MAYNKAAADKAEGGMKKRTITAILWLTVSFLVSQELQKIRRQLASF